MDRRAVENAMTRTQILTGKFPVEDLANLNGTGWLQQDQTLLWNYDGETFDLRDVRTLKSRMERYRKAANYDEVRFFNRILRQIDFVRKNVAVEHLPETLQIEHTDACNARCIMCNHFFTRNHNCTFLDMELIHRLEDVFPYVESVVLNGIGEPLLHPNIMEIMRIYEKYGIRLTTNTNLSIMNPELAQLMQRTFYDIQISCDACDSETYGRIRNGLSFETFKQNARMLRSAGNVEICMATVVMRQNVTQLPGIVELAADLGCAKVVMLDLNTSRLLENTGDSIENFPRTAAYYMSRAQETADKRGIYIHTLEYVRQKAGVSADKGGMDAERKLLRAAPLYPSRELSEKLYDLYRKTGFMNPIFRAEQTDYCAASASRCDGYCQFIESRPFISAQGNVFNCCTRRMHTMGNIRAASLQEIWNGAPMQKIRRVMASGFLPKYCVDCTYLRSDLMSDRIRVDSPDAFSSQNAYDRLRMELIRARLEQRA